jgi:hypothetical protein
MAAPVPVRPGQNESPVINADHRTVRYRAITAAGLRERK